MVFTYITSLSEQSKSMFDRLKQTSMSRLSYYSVTYLFPGFGDLPNTRRTRCSEEGKKLCRKARFNARMNKTKKSQVSKLRASAFDHTLRERPYFAAEL